MPLWYSAATKNSGAFKNGTVKRRDSCYDVIPAEAGMTDKRLFTRPSSNQASPNLSIARLQQMAR